MMYSLFDLVTAYTVPLLTILLTTSVLLGSLVWYESWSCLGLVATTVLVPVCLAVGSSSLVEICSTL